MGIAIIIDSDFSQKNIGKVTFLTEGTPLSGLSISGINTVVGVTSQYSVEYTPSNTTQKGITWSITAGGSYASINSSTGLLNIKPGANTNSVTIKATSIKNPSISATKTITVTYDNTILLTGLGIVGDSFVNGTNAQYNVTYTPSNTTQKGVTWSVQSGSSYASIDNNGLLTVKPGANNSSVVIAVTSSVNPDITITKTIMVTYQNAILVTGLSISGDSTVVGTEAQYTVSYTPENTTQKGVIWSIESGSEYADIDSSGKITIKSGAIANKVTIKATSSVNPEVSATKDITVSYDNQIVIEGITITGISSTDEITTQYGISYAPSNTTQKGVTWSIESGSEYASIGSSTGILTVKEGTSMNTVRIKAVSNHNSSIIATKGITVTYPAVSNKFWNLTGHIGYVPIPKLDITNFSCLLEFEDELTPTSGGTINIVLATQSMGVGTSGRCHLSLCSSYSRLQARSSNFDVGNGEGWKATDQNKEFVFNQQNKLLLINPDNGYQGANSPLSQTAWTLLTNNVGMGQFTGYLQFGTKLGGGDAYKYSSNEDLSTAVTNGTVSASDNLNLKIKTFILFCNTKYSSVSDMLANRANADVDIRFNGNGTPYNAGTSGTLIYSGY